MVVSRKHYEDTVRWQRNNKDWMESYSKFYYESNRDRILSQRKERRRKIKVKKQFKILTNIVVLQSYYIALGIIPPIIKSNKDINKKTLDQMVEHYLKNGGVIKHQEPTKDYRGYSVGTAKSNSPYENLSGFFEV